MAKAIVMPIVESLVLFREVAAASTMLNVDSCAGGTLEDSDLDLSRHDVVVGNNVKKVASGRAGEGVRNRKIGRDAVKVATLRVVHCSAGPSCGESNR